MVNAERPKGLDAARNRAGPIFVRLCSGQRHDLNQFGNPSAQRRRAINRFQREGGFKSMAIRHAWKSHGVAGNFRIRVASVIWAAGISSREDQ